MLFEILLCEFGTSFVDHPELAEGVVYLFSLPDLFIYFLL